MRVTLVSPPSLSFPNPIYHALPLLAGALVREGHDVRQVDLNVLAADHLLTREWGERVLEVANDALAVQPAVKGSPLEGIIKRNTPGLMNAPQCKADLRDMKAVLDPDRFKTAFDTVLEALNFCYLPDPIVPVYSDTFSRDISTHVQTDAWSPLRDLYDAILIDDVLRGDPELIGISVAYQEQIVNSIKVAARIRKRNKDVHICFGGIQLSYFPDKWLEDGWLLRIADSMVIGDGETAVVELADALEGNRGMDQVRNLVYIDGSGKIKKNNEEPFLEEMDQLPVPDFDSADLSPYFTPEPIFPVMTCRGCYWGKCTFCSECSYKGFRTASREKVRTDLLALTRGHGARYVMVQDSGITPRSALELASIVKEESLPVHWIGASRLEKIFLDKAHCWELAEGGCRSLMLGFESASQRVLDRMDKGYQAKDLPAMLVNLRKVGISSELLWFIGFPTETREEALQTARFLVAHKESFGMAIFVGRYGLYQDTILYEKRDELGIRIESIENGLCRFKTPGGMTEEEADELVRIFGPTSNLILATSGAHLFQLEENGLELTPFVNPMSIPEGIESQ